MRSIKLFIKSLCFFVFRIFPIQKNKIFFDNYNGRSFGCNPKYIAEKLHELYPEYKIVFQVQNGFENGFPDYIKLVKFESIQSIYEQVTSKVWVTNVRRSIIAKKRKGQFYIQTWHGAIGVKKCEKDALDKITPQSIKQALHDSPLIDLMISNSGFCTSVYKRAFWYSGKIAEFGYPRNDLIVNPKEDVVRKYFNLKSETKILFYAPTFRKDTAAWDSELDIKRILKAYENKFGGNWICLLRLHPWAKKHCKGKNLYNEYTLNATDYPDIQELLAYSDSIITDYSSCMFDFLISRKPAFMFAPDIKNYLNERGLLFEINELPFACALNNDELEKAILDFEEPSYLKKVNDFFAKYTLKDDGKASERCADLIHKLCSSEQFEDALKEVELC